ncbi:MAG: S46 family peptidase [Bacteroidota bacterium]
MKKFTSVITVLIFAVKIGFAGEGMWIPMLLEQLNEPEMKSMGMRISAEDIYSINKSSLKDAVLLFGRGCTAEIISDEGLILTNHHCGYGQIQKHSSVEYDYLTSGFWAMDRSQELPNPGLSVTLLVRMEDVTKQILEGVTSGMTEKARAEIIKANTDKLEKVAVEGTAYNAKIRAFYYGNEFYLFITQTFNDVRLVGAPPSNIGKFGGDTDNWMWPRHTGDFSMFRIYVNKNNEPAEYSPDNVPYKPKSHLPISLKGVEKGDFTFVFGYPGSTQEYLPSYAVEMITGIENPPAIRLREKRLGIFDNYMKQSDLVRIQYSDKYAGVANYWKKMIGENRGIRKLDAIEKKQELESQFTAWASADAARAERYGGLLPRFELLYTRLKPISETETYLIEGGLGIEALRYAYSFNQLLAKSRDKSTPDEEIGKLVTQLQGNARNFFRNYNQSVDRSIFASLMADWIEHQDPEKIPEAILQGAILYNNNFEAWADKVYQQSIFTDSSRVKKLLKNFKVKNFRKISDDLMFRLSLSAFNHYFNQIQPESQQISAELDSLQRIYMQGLMEFQPDKRFYPDANSTLRVTYGKVDDYFPHDAVHYRYYTTLEGIMEKEDPAIYDYVVEPRLKQLYAEKDYGYYGAKDGTMRIAFIGSNHTTGGNSGSPVLNADGQLVGINFDRNWEGTMSDLMYDPDQCRNISLDIRYCLFIIDKFAGAGHLVKEMTIID